MRLGDRRTRRRHVDAEVAEVRQSQILQQQAAVGVRVVAHPQLALRRQCGDLRVEPAVRVEQFVGAVGRQPVGQHLQMLRGVAGVGERNLVRAPRSCGLLAVDVGRAGPAFRGPEHDHRPARAIASSPAAAGIGLDLGDFVEDGVEQFGEPAMRVGVVVAGSSSGTSKKYGLWP